MDLFECKVRYKRQQDDGKLIPMNELYLVEAVSFGEAEKMTLEVAAKLAFMGEEINMAAIRKVKYAEIIPNPQGHFWYIAKVEMKTYDEASGKEKLSVMSWLVQETSMEEAYKKLSAILEKDATVECSIKQLQESKIMDVLRIAQ